MGTKIGASGQVLVPKMGPFFGSHFGNHKWGLKYKVNNGPRSGSQNENQIWTPNWVPPIALRGRKVVPKMGPFFGSQTGHPQFAFLGPPFRALGQGFGFSWMWQSGFFYPSPPLPFLPSFPSPSFRLAPAPPHSCLPPFVPTPFLLPCSVARLFPVPSFPAPSSPSLTRRRFLVSLLLRLARHSA